MARNNHENRDMNRYRGGNFDRAYNRTFRRANDVGGGYEEDVTLHGSGYGSGRDYEGDFGESSRSQGWDQNMRQNDFGTRRYREDNFRSTRWGASRGSEEGPHYGKGPKGWRRSDERIREEACEALYRDRRIDASEIEVSVSEGILTLKGVVDSRDTKRAVERCVEEVSGVSDVHNQLRVNASGKEPFNTSLS